MALIRTIRCIKCNLLSDEDVHTQSYKLSIFENDYPTGICSYCKHKIKETEKAVYLKGLEALSTEERIKKIEEYIYDHSNTNHNIREFKYR